MQFELRDFQDIKVRELLDEIDAGKALHHRGRRYAITFSAPTGAGKTVMASAVIEALLYGSNDLSVDAVPEATILWFSDDPNLNRQTRTRFLEASSLITETQLVEIDTAFDQPLFDRGRVYFLNTDKLA